MALIHTEQDGDDSCDILMIGDKLMMVTQYMMYMNGMILYLDGCEGGHDGGRAEAVGDHGEVGEVALYAGVKDGLGPGVAEGGPVLVQQVHQLFCNQPAQANSLL